MWWAVAGLVTGCGPASQFTENVFSCNETLRFPDGTVDVKYQFAEFTDETRLVTCELRSGVATATETWIHLPGTSGHQTGQCSVLYDFDDNSGGTWFFDFDLLNRHATVRYDDPGNPISPSKNTIACTRGSVDL